MSHAKAAETVGELPRWPVGCTELHRRVAEEGAALEAARAAETEALLGARPDRRGRPRRRGTVWVSVDGTMVHDRASGTELEVKIGLVFDGTRRTGRSRRVLTGRTLYAGAETWTGLAERFTGRERRRRAHGVLGPDGEGGRHRRRPTFRGSRHELTPARGVGPRPPPAPAAQRDLTALLVGPLRSATPALTIGGLSQHRRSDASRPGSQPDLRGRIVGSIVGLPAHRQGYGWRCRRLGPLARRASARGVSAYG